MSNSSSLASITSRLTPSTTNLGKVEAMASKLLFTKRSLHVWGRSFIDRYALLFWNFESHASTIVVLDPLIGQEIGRQPIKNTVSYGVLSSSINWDRASAAAAAATLTFWWRRRRFFESKKGSKTVNGLKKKFKNISSVQESKRSQTLLLSFLKVSESYTFTF